MSNERVVDEAVRIGETMDEAAAMYSDMKQQRDEAITERDYAYLALDSLRPEYWENDSGRCARCPLCGETDRQPHSARNRPVPKCRPACPIAIAHKSLAANE